MATIWNPGDTVSPDNLRQDLATVGVGKGGDMVAVNRGDVVGVRDKTLTTFIRTTKVSVWEFLTSAEIDAVVSADVVDISANWQKALDSGRALYYPPGLYRGNVVANLKQRWEGDGSTDCTLYPFNFATAIVTARTKAPYWTYHSVISGIGFLGFGTTGVGFTYAVTNPNSKGFEDEYCNNWQFMHCFFKDLEKGFQAPCGNIGTRFIDCGFEANKYGAYILSNRFGGDPMHAGNKYWLGGEIRGNVCGVYINNAAVGVGGIVFDGTIFELNQIDQYFYNEGGPMNEPIRLQNIWSESSGAVPGTNPPTWTLDQWTGSVRSDLVVDTRSTILDGSSVEVALSHGPCHDIVINGTDSRVIASHAKPETQAGFGGAAMNVVGVDSSIYLDDSCYTDGGKLITSSKVLSGGIKFSRKIISNDLSDAITRVALTTPRINKIANLNLTGVSETFELQVDLTGSFGVTGTVVSDGRIFADCNEYSATIGANNFFLPVATNVISSAGWYVYTFDVKVISGNPTFFLWNLTTDAFMVNFNVPVLGEWVTAYGIGKSLGVGSFSLIAGSYTSVGACVWRWSAFQAHRFDTEQECLDFIRNATYVLP